MELNFDANTVDPTPAYGTIPPGEYEVMIVESEQRATKKDDGSYLSLTLEVQSGEYQGRKLFDRLNLDNPNRKAVEIAQRTLSQICHATGVLQVKDSFDLHHHPMIAVVKVRPEREDPISGKFYEASNEIKEYRRVAPLGSAPQRPAAAAPPQPRQQARQQATTPWGQAR
jgi:hypothetical protein